MSWLNNIRDAAAARIRAADDESLAQSLNDGLAQAEALAERSEDEAIRTSGVAAVQALRNHSSELGQLGMHGTAAVAGFLASGQNTRAVDLFLIEKAGRDQINQAVKSAQSRAVRAKKNRAAARATALDVLGKVGTATAQAALPFLLGALK